MKLNDRFCVQEYVPKSIYEEYGSRSIRWVSNTIIEADLQLLLDLEEEFGRKVSCTINDWKWNASGSQYRGRRVEGEPNWSPTSLHAHGAASDKLFYYKNDDGSKERIENRVIYDFVRKYEARYYALGIRRIEDIRDAKTWLHWDTCWTGASFKDRLQVVRG